jgi:pSer/pThr/pTyr-binding forkhead associated (FHA) protein
MGRRSASRAYCYDMEPPDCLIAQPYPYTVSRRHCEIERLPDGVIIRDLNSRLGTIVNGERLRVFHGQYSQVSLGEGEHTLVLGKSDGQVGFRVIVSKSVRQST